jgi:hypothetical protein
VAQASRLCNRRLKPAATKIVRRVQLGTKASLLSEGWEKTVKQLNVMLLLVCLSVLCSTPALSWDPTELPPGFTVTDPGAPVELEGRPLFYVRLNTKSETAQQIAQRISERIKKLAQDPTFKPQSINVQDTALSSDIRAGD